MSDITFGRVPHPHFQDRPIYKREGAGQNNLGKRTVKGVVLGQLLREVQSGKLAKVLFSNDVVGNRRINGIEEGTDTLALDDCDPSLLLGAPAYAPVPTSPFATSVVATVLTDRRKAHVLTPTIKPIAIDVVNDQTFGRVHDVAMKVNVAMVGASTNATPGVPMLATPSDRPLELKDSGGVLGTDDCGLTATQRDNYGIVVVRHLLASLQAWGCAVARSVCRTAGLFTLPKLYQKGV